MVLVCMNEIVAAVTARISSTSKCGSRVVLHSIGARTSNQRSNRRLKARNDTFLLIITFLYRSVPLEQPARLATDVPTMREFHVGVL